MRTEKARAFPFGILNKKNPSENPFFNSEFHVIETLSKRTCGEGAKEKFQNAWIND